MPARGPGGKFLPKSEKPTGLYTETPMPTRATSPAPKPQKQPGNLKTAWNKALKTAKVLTTGEVDDFRDDLIRGINGAFEAFDKFMSATNKRGETALIWSNIPDPQIEILADYLLERGQKSVVIAQGVRGIVQTWRAYAALLIVGPAAMESFAFYMKNGIGFPVFVPGQPGQERKSA